MDNILKNIDEKGDVNEQRRTSIHSLALETEAPMWRVRDDGLVGFTPSTSNNQNYHNIKSDYQTTGLIIPPPPETGYRSGITGADITHQNYFSLLTTFTKKNTFLIHNPHIVCPSHPITQKGVNKSVTCYTNSIYIQCNTIYMSYYLKIT